MYAILIPGESTIHYLIIHFTSPIGNQGALGGWHRDLITIIPRCTASIEARVGGKRAPDLRRTHSSIMLGSRTMVKRWQIPSSMAGHSVSQWFVIASPQIEQYNYRPIVVCF